MRTTNIKKLIVGGVTVLVTTDGQLIRKPNGWRKSSLTSGIANDCGYMGAYIAGKRHRVHRLVAEAFLPDYSEELQVDHIDGNRKNNRLTNLRMATCADNHRGFKGAWGKSKYRGVYIREDRPTPRWVARVSLNGKRHRAGTYGTEKEAALAYNEKAAELGFDKAAMNVI